MSATQTKIVFQRTLARLIIMIGIFSLMWVATSACSSMINGQNGDGEEDPTDTSDLTGDKAIAKLPAIKWAIKKEIAPAAKELPPTKEGRPPRPLSAVGGEDQPTGTFVQNELVLFSDDDDEVKQFAERIGGEIVLTEDPADAGVEGPKMHLILVEDPEVDLDTFESQLTALILADDGELGNEVSDDGEHGDATSEILFSDDKGLALVALAATAVHEDGLDVAVNWVAEPHVLPVSTEEDPNGYGGHHDAYNFDWFTKDSGMKTGVTEAWNLLHHGDKLGNEVSVAILDMGFKVTSDLENVTASTVWPGFGPLNQKNIYPCSGGSDCPWHGTDVAGAAMGIEDNQFGSAGPAGPVAKPILVYTTYDYLASITAVYRARNKGAKVINMSYSAPVPWWLKWTTAGFRHATSAVRDSGVLLFASAGNSGDNVDSKICFLGHCWEKTFYTPCENGGVTCVGGLASPHVADESSNFGDNSVDLWGPWCVDVGPNPKDDFFHQACGTSLSSPFVAGVAALVFAANPYLSADEVSDILAETADGYREEKVNAYEAVLTAIGTLKSVEIVDPAPGGQFILGVPSPLTADVTFISKPGSSIDVNLTWISSLEGELGTQQITVQRKTGDVHSERVYFDYLLSEGHHDITLVAEISMPGGDIFPMPPTVVEAYSDVTVTNPGPTVTIETPTSGDTFCEGQTVMFQASAEDANQQIPDSSYSWSTVLEGGTFPIFYLVNAPVMTTSSLAPGTHTVTVRVSDEGGQFDTDSVQVEILPITDPTCSNLPPQLIITEPRAEQVFMASGYDASGAYADLTLKATATDHEDANSSLVVKWYDEDQSLIATGASTTGRIYMTETCNSEHTITARVTDSDQNTVETSVTIHIYIVC